MYKLVSSAAAKKVENMEEANKSSTEKTPGVVIYGNSRLSDRVNAFQQKAEQHKSKQLSNPFSGHMDSGATKKPLDVNDPK